MLYRYAMHMQFLSIFQIDCQSMHAKIFSKSTKQIKKRFIHLYKGSFFSEASLVIPASAPYINGMQSAGISLVVGRDPACSVVNQPYLHHAPSFRASTGMF